jgi:NAD(P)H dehydrogenase (quinone)
MILVTGAAGKTGKAVVRALAARKAAVRALVRRQEHARALTALGAADVSSGSFEDARALSASMADVSAVYHICPNVSRDEVKFARAVITAARAHKVRRFVYHSVLQPRIEAMPHHWEKLRVEQSLRSEGFELTILQPAAYMQNLLAAWPGVIGDGVLRIPYPAATRLSLVDLDDVAAAAATVLTEVGHGGATYELVGTIGLSQNDLAAAISAELGRTIRIEEEPVAAWEARAKTSGIDEYGRVTLAAMFRYYANHGLVGDPAVLQRLLGQAPNDLGRFLAALNRIAPH